MTRRYFHRFGFLNHTQILELEIDSTDKGVRVPVKVLMGLLADAGWQETNLVIKIQESGTDVVGDTQ